MGPHDELGRLAAAILANRRMRPTLLPDELFGEWAWEALLMLFVADTEGRRITGRFIATELSCSPTVFSRWLQHLSKSDLVIGDGNGDLDDLLTLSAHAIGAMETYLANTCPTGRVLC